jgi:hypothetical protein
MQIYTIITLHNANIAHNPPLIERICVGFTLIMLLDSISIISKAIEIRFSSFSPISDKDSDVEDE